jgi:hypothetical protein
MTHSTSSSQILPEHTVPEQTSSEPVDPEQTIPEQTNFIQPSQQLTIPVSEQIQPPPQSQIQILSVSDQPSTSSDIQILEQPPLDILDSDYNESELIKISTEMQSLVQLRRVPTLYVAYEELLDTVSKKCLRIQAAAVRRYLRNLHLVEQARGPLLYLANEPFYSESEYVSREAKVFKMLKQILVKQQEESKAREDSLLQRQLAFEDFVKQQFELLKKQSEEISRMKELIQHTQQTNP